MKSQQKTILVTGGAGYIGSHIVLDLKSSGYNVIILDNLVYGHQDLVDQVLQVPLIIGDIGNRELLDRVFQTHHIDAVMHFAAYAYVGESVVQPDKYYRNNVVGTLTLLEAMQAASVKRLVFSSTCATYGIPDVVPISEDQAQNPINPYGASKLMVERILADFQAALGLQYVCFRYFNAAGADPLGRLGEDHTPEPHLIPLILNAAAGFRDGISIYGTDYPTPDGTCIRDYIHVSDLAQAHRLGLQYLFESPDSHIFNLGNSRGFSVREVIEAVKTITGKDFDVYEEDRRPGDPPILLGSNTKAVNLLGWHPQYPDLESILSHAWQWHKTRKLTPKFSLPSV